MCIRDSPRSTPKLVDVPTPEKQVKLEAAFFDLDNTLLRGASSFLFAKAAFERRFVNRRELYRFAWQQFKFIWRGESAKLLSHIEDRAMSLVVGQSAKALEDLVGIAWQDYVQAKMWPETVRIAQEHIAAGREVWIITAAPIQMGQYIAKQLGLTGALGTVLEVKNGLLTGEFEGRPLHGEGKAVAIKQLAKENIETQDWDPVTFVKFLRNEIDKWSPLAKSVEGLR